jgi:chaperonin cofactor prefoldin
MNTEIINQRIEQLKAQEATLQLQLDEIRYLIQAML